MAEYCLTAEEVLYLAAVAGADMFYGVPDTLSGLSDQELKLKVVEVEDSLGKKGYLNEDFDGNKSVPPGLMKLIERCGNSERFICFEKSRLGEPDYACMYFMSGQEAWKMESGSQYVFSETLFANIPKEIGQGIELKEAERKAGDCFCISMDEMEKTANLARRGSADKGAELLGNAGASEFAAKAVINGILGKTDYYALLFMELENEFEPGYSVQFLSGETLVAMECVIQEDEDFIKFSMIDNAELEKRLRAGFEKVGCVGGDEQFV